MMDSETFVFLVKWIYDSCEYDCRHCPLSVLYQVGNLESCDRLIHVIKSEECSEYMKTRSRKEIAKRIKEYMRIHEPAR